MCSLPSYSILSAKCPFSCQILTLSKSNGNYQRQEDLRAQVLFLPINKSFEIQIRLTCKLFKYSNAKESKDKELKNSRIKKF